jgi:hypothetical protein
MKNKVVLISSHCNTEEKIDILEENLKILNNFGVDIFLTSKIDLPDRIKDLVNIFLYSKFDFTYKWPEKSISCWNIFDKYQMNIFVDDYGYSHLFQVKQLSKLAMAFDYEYFYHMLYDVEIDKHVKNFIVNENPTFKNFSASSLPGVPPGLQLTGLNKHNLNILSDLITEESYLKDKSLVMEDWVKRVSEVVPMEISEHKIKDRIRYNNTSQINTSVSNKYKLFYSTSEKRILIYDIQENVLFKNNKFDEEKEIIENTIIKIKGDIFYINGHLYNKNDLYTYPSSLEIKE